MLCAISTAYFSSSVLHLATNSQTGTSVPLGVTYTESPTWTIVSNPPVGAAQATASLARTPLLIGSNPINIVLTVNGLAQQLGKDYLLNGSNLSWISTGFSLDATDIVAVTYTGA